LVEDIYKGYGQYGNNGQGGTQVDLNNPDVVESEIQRAQAVIANRLASGMDTVNQEAYLNKLNASRNEYMKSSNYVSSLADKSAEGYFTNQKGMLESAKASGIAELEKVYADAVNDGRISVREAETQFENAKAEIEQLALQDQEYTRLTAQNRGIQNSQQMIGLIQGDNARKNKLINSSMSERDLRINNIKDRINSVMQKKNLDIVNLNSQYDAGLIQARGQADMIKAEAMQNLALKNWEMSESDKYANKQMETQFNYKIKEMLKSHELDLDTLDVQFQNELKKMGMENSYRMGQIAAQARASAKSAQDDYALKMQRAKASITPGTPEYEVAIGQAKMERDLKIRDIYDTTVATKQAEAVMNNPYLPENYGGVIPEPVDVSYNWGALGNWWTDYDEKKSGRDKQKAAMEAKAKLLNY